MGCKNHLMLPIEDMGCFAWEERYRFLPERAEEYEERRKQEPSYRDTYELLNFEDEHDTYAGLMVKVRRMPGRKRFVLPLVDLKASDPQSPNYQFLHDYSVWVKNWRR
jgi:hypothetical protein